MRRRTVHKVKIFILKRQVIGLKTHFTFISQFLYQPCWFGANQIDQRLYPPTANVDFMTAWPEFLAIQNGQQPNASITYGPNPRYIINGRDLSHWVHVDVLFQAYFHAALILLHGNAPLKPTVPYVTTEQNQMAFGTFGAPEIAGALGELAPLALKVFCLCTCA